VTRDLVWDGCRNVRDLGGLPTEGGGETRRGAIVRGDNVRLLSDAGWDALRAHGVRTLVDLRWHGELADDPPRDIDLDVVNVSLFGPDDPGAISELARGIEELEPVAQYREFYLRALEAHRAEFREALAAIADAKPGGVLVHCVAGKDRTGLVVALLLRLAGVSAGEIAEDFGVSEERLDRPGDAPAQAMAQVVAELERRYGSVDAYLRSTGLTHAQVERLRARLREER
jgi:hypothetical protein